MSWAKSPGGEGTEGLASASGPGGTTHPSLLSKAIAATAAGVGITALTGWWAGLPAAVTLLPGFPPVVPNTAAGLILAGGALWLASGDNRSAPRLRTAQALALLLAALGFLTLLEYWFGMNLGIDQLLLSNSTQAMPQSPFPGRPSPQTALCFVNLGLALMLLDVELRDGWRPARFLAVVVEALVFMVLLGYLYGLSGVYEVAPRTGMAIPTAASLAALAIGVLTARPGRGVWSKLSVMRGIPRSAVGLLIVFGLIAGELLTVGTRTFPHLHTILDTCMFLLPGVLAMLLWDIGSRLDDSLFKFISVTFGITAILEGLHVVAAIEWSGPLALIAAARSVLQPTTWPPPAHVLPAGILASLWLTRRGRKQVAAMAVALIFLGAGLLVLFRWLPHYVSPDWLGVTRPTLILVPCLWAAAGLACWRLHPIHRLLPVLTAMAAASFLVHVPMLFSQAPHDAQAMAAHFAKVGTYLFVLLSVMRMASSDMLNLRRAEEKFRGMLESAPDAMVIVDRQGSIVIVNSQAEKLFGYSRAEMLGQKVEMLVPTRFRGHHPGHRGGFFADPRVRSMGAGLDLYGLRKDGTEFPVEISLSPLATEEGVLVSSAIRDISERRRAEEKFRALLESAPDAMVIVNREGSMVLVNSQAERLFGYSRAEMLGQKVELLVPRRFRGHHPGHRGGFFADPRVRSMGAGLDLYGLRKDGTEFPVEISLSPLETEEGMLVSSAIRDITERRRAEERFRAVAETASDAIVSADSQGNIIYFNSAATKIFGYAAREAVGQPLTFLMPERFHHAHRQGFQRYLATREARVVGRTVELVGRRKDGSEFPLQLSLANWSAGGEMFFTGIIGDITDRKLAEEELRNRSLQLEAANKELETFAYSVSHDLRAPLRSIDGFSQALLQDHAHALDDTAKQHLARVCRATDRMATLIDDLLNLSRVTRTQMQPQSVDLSTMAASIADELRRREPNRNVEFRIVSGLTVRGDSRLLRIVMENLLENAWKFTAKHSQAHIEVGREARNGMDAVFVRDDGAGFDMAYAGKLFGPFQRLHAMTEFPGTGIGLATVQRIIHRHGGEVWAEGQLEKGATIYFAVRA